MFSILSFSGIELSNQELIRFGAWFEKLLFMRQDAAGPRPRLTGVLETVKSLQTVKSLGVHWRNKAEEGNLIYFNFSQLKLSLQLSQMFFAKKLSKLFTTLSFHWRQGTNPLSTRQGMLGGGVLAFGNCPRYLNLIASLCRSINNYCKQFFMKYFCNIKNIARPKKKRNESTPKKERGCWEIGRSCWLGCCQRQLKLRVKTATANGSKRQRKSFAF